MTDDMSHFPQRNATWRNIFLDYLYTMYIIDTSKQETNRSKKMKNQQTSIEFKSLIESQHTGIIDAYINENGGFNVICKKAKTANKIKFDFCLSGLKNIKISEPNLFNNNYHISASA
jgi:hypothetical protein